MKKQKRQNKMQQKYFIIKHLTNQKIRKILRRAFP